VKAVEPGRLEVRLGVSGLYGSTEHLAECPDLGPQCGQTPPPLPYYHHVGLILSDVTADASYGLAPWLAVEGRFVLRIVDLTPTYREIDGTPKLVPDDIHHHDRTIVGPADPWIMARFGAAWGKLTTAARLGLSLPVGRTEPDPYRLGAEGKWHEHTQLGSGTVIPIVGMGLSYALDPVELSVSALGLFSVYENDEGFRAPTRIFGGLRAAFPLLSRKLSPYATVDLAHEGTEIWHGTYGLEGFNARTDLLAGAGIAWEFLPTYRLDVGLKARVYRFTSTPSFDYPGIAQCFVTKFWDLDKPRDEHAH